uniref:Uncharacterized protein n=1 Tax=Anopheles melas TaxID=34690 RepID=A0A182U193_9DIPT
MVEQRSKDDSLNRTVSDLASLNRDLDGKLLDEMDDNDMEIESIQENRNLPIHANGILAHPSAGNHEPATQKEMKMYNEDALLNMSSCLCIVVKIKNLALAIVEDLKNVIFLALECIILSAAREIIFLIQNTMRIPSR